MPRTVEKKKHEALLLPDPALPSKPHLENIFS